jgi:hypothetical protein
MKLILSNLSLVTEPQHGLTSLIFLAVAVELLTLFF